MIELRYGSAELSDDVFVAEFESCRFPNRQVIVYFDQSDGYRISELVMARTRSPHGEGYSS
jgi:hypothetical protein